MDVETVEKFLPESRPVDECGTGRRDRLCVRFCRKKFKCVVIFMLLGISMCQTTALILKSIDFDELSTYVNKSTSANDRKSNFGLLIDKLFGESVQTGQMKYLDTPSIKSILQNFTDAVQEELSYPHVNGS